MTATNIKSIAREYCEQLSAQRLDNAGFVRKLGWHGRPKLSQEGTESRHRSSINYLS